ncbi:chascon [Anaeramoeba flamelloides]|uniref:Chascon n=1 Tax=Anaeramoeba flamelloides TaxID=1746091 RepID=A0ABQ8ZEG3_9EUKA|nr:chascon [Anaeramoeba flamelloides]
MIYQELFFENPYFFNPARPHHTRKKERKKERRKEGKKKKRKYINVLSEISQKLGKTQFNNKINDEIYVLELYMNEGKEWMERSARRSDIVSMCKLLGVGYDARRPSKSLEEYIFLKPLLDGLKLSNNDFLISQLELWKIKYCKKDTKKQKIENLCRRYFQWVHLLLSANKKGLQKELEKFNLKKEGRKDALIARLITIALPFKQVTKNIKPLSQELSLSLELEKERERERESEREKKREREKEMEREMEREIEMETERGKRERERERRREMVEQDQKTKKGKKKQKSSSRSLNKAHNNKLKLISNINLVQKSVACQKKKKIKERKRERKGFQEKEKPLLRNFTKINSNIKKKRSSETKKRLYKSQPQISGYPKKKLKNKNQKHMKNSNDSHDKQSLKLVRENQKGNRKVKQRERPRDRERSKGRERERERGKGRERDRDKRNGKKYQKTLTERAVMCRKRKNLYHKTNESNQRPVAYLDNSQMNGGEGGDEGYVNFINFSSGNDQESKRSNNKPQNSLKKYKIDFEKKKIRTNSKLKLAQNQKQIKKRKPNKPTFIQKRTQKRKNNQLNFWKNSSGIPYKFGKDGLSKPLLIKIIPSNFQKNANKNIKKVEEINCDCQNQSNYNYGINTIKNINNPNNTKTKKNKKKPNFNTFLSLSQPHYVTKQNIDNWFCQMGNTSTNFSLKFQTFHHHYNILKNLNSQTIQNYLNKFQINHQNRSHSEKLLLLVPFVSQIRKIEAFTEKQKMNFDKLLN